MPTKFEHAIAIVLGNEGGLTNDKEDSGGITNFGIINDDIEDAISKGIIPKNTTVKGLTIKQAIAIYKELYYDNCPNLDKINYVFNMK